MKLKGLSCVTDIGSALDMTRDAHDALAWIFENQNGATAMFAVAFIVAKAEPRLEFTQIACFDRLAAQRAERLRTGRPAVHKKKSHVAPPNANDLFCESDPVRRPVPFRVQQPLQRPLIMRSTFVSS